MNEGSYIIHYMYHQFIDIINFEYINMSREQRQKNFNKISKRIARYDEEAEYYTMKKAIDEAAKI